jgi:uncharacterized protein
MSSCSLQFGEHALDLLPERAVVIKELNALILSDVHLGKGAHFRRNGLPVPDGAFQDDLQRLSSLVTNTGCDVYVVGDLVHATHNEEWERFAVERSRWRNELTLIMGNHDQHIASHAVRLDAHLSAKHAIGNLLLVHDEGDLSNEDVHKTNGQIVGHVHPAIRLDGDRFACFHLQGSILTLPAFGRFTGMKTMSLEAADCVYVCLDQQVLQIKQGHVNGDLTI